MSRATNARKKRLIRDNPFCYLCGGGVPSETVDHVPPRACFPDGYEPEGLEFAACKECNNATSRSDQIFGLLTMLVDFDEGNRTSEHLEKFQRIFKQVAVRYPEALPSMPNARPVMKADSLFTPSPVAYEVGTTPHFDEALRVMGVKLTHALYYRHSSRALTSDRYFLSGCYQLQNPSMKDLTELLARMLPEQEIGGRVNRKNYGNRFGYKWLPPKVEGFFLYAAQFGRGLVIWGVVLEIGASPGGLAPELATLARLDWRRGGCGPGLTGSGVKLSADNAI
jgi:hypothetical protein